MYSWDSSTKINHNQGPHELEQWIQQNKFFFQHKRMIIIRYKINYTYNDI